MECCNRKMSPKHFIALNLTLLPVLAFIFKWNFAECISKVLAVSVLLQYVLKNFTAYSSDLYAPCLKKMNARLLEILYEKIYTFGNLIANGLRKSILVEEWIFTVRAVKIPFGLSHVALRTGDSVFFVVLVNVLLFFPELRAFWARLQEKKAQKQALKQAQPADAKKSTVKKVKTIAQYILKLKKNGVQSFVPVLKKILLRLEAKVPRYTEQE